MTSRREFLQIGLAGAAFIPYDFRLKPAECSFWLKPEATAAGELTDLYKVIFDERFPTSVAFARAMNRQGIPSHGIRGDITALWYHDLYFQWSKGSGRIAGVTTKASLFCLETLARDAGLRVTDRRAIDDGLVAWSIGPSERTSRHG